MKSTSYAHFVLLLIFSILMFGCASRYGDRRPIQHDPEAMALLGSAKAFYESMPEWSSQFFVEHNWVDSKNGSQHSSKWGPGEYSIRRPDKFSIRYKDDAAASVGLIGNGKKTWIILNVSVQESKKYSIDAGVRYSETSARSGFKSLENPGIIEGCFGISEEVTCWLPSGGLFDDLLTDSGESILLLSIDPNQPDRRTVRIISAECIEDFTFQSGDKPWLIRYSRDYDAWIEMRSHEGEIVPSNPIRGSDSVEFSNWTNAAETDAFFYKPPTNARKMNNVLSDVLLWAKKNIPPAPLTGKAVPARSVHMLDGQERSLNDIRAGGVLVLEFWATWCGPCRMSLPRIASVVKEYEGKGVHMLAVNYGEEHDAVVKQLSQQHWTFPVAVDTDHAVTTAFDVTAVPVTFVVGKSGNIVQVLEGGWPDIDDRLRAILDEALR